MCGCGHGMDRHYLDYAGPGIPAGIPTRCLEKDCSCKQYGPFPSMLPLPFHQRGSAGWPMPFYGPFQGPFSGGYGSGSTKISP